MKTKVVYCTFGTAAEPWAANVIGTEGKKLVVSGLASGGSVIIAVPPDTVFDEKSEAITQCLRRVVAQIKRLHALEKKLRRAAVAARKAETDAATMKSKGPRK